MNYEEEFNKLLEEQMRKAGGARLEQLRREKTGERKLFADVLRPVMPSSSLAEVVLEYEMVSLSGVRIYLDFYFPTFRWAVECLGYVPHAEMMTRERFDFEQVRVHTLDVYSITHIPFSWDQINKKTEYCRRVMYEMLGRNSAVPGDAYRDLTIHEREVIRYAKYLNRPLKIGDVCSCTHLKDDAARNIIKMMVSKGLVKPLGKGKVRFHQFLLDEKAYKYRL